jgi:hypothetical protein
MINFKHIATRINKTEYYIIAAFVATNLIIHLVADFNSGYHCDELLHIDAGRHLAFGYMDFAPMIAYLAFIQNLFQSDSIFVNHLFVHFAAALILVLCGLITIKLGGKWLAVLVTLSCILFSPGFGVSHTLFLPVVFEQLTWIVCIYYLISFCNNPTNKYLIWIGIFAAIGFLTKYSIVFFLGGLFCSILIFQRTILRKNAFWIACILFLIIILPNILWQLNNGLPFFKHFSTLYETQLDNNSRLEELKTLVLFSNPLLSIFWIAGLLIVPFIYGFEKYRLVGFSLIVSFLLLFVAKGKAYYYLPIILGLLPLGAIFFESLLQQRRWVLISYLSLSALFGIILLPRCIPIIPLDKYISLYNLKKNKDNKIPIAFENYYSKEIWDHILRSVNTTYHNLPTWEQKKCLIWGRHYSQAGGINLLGRNQALPRAFSFHSSCYNWVPNFTNNITVIVIADPNWDKDHWLRYFHEVNEVDSIENPYTSDKKWYYQRIFLCRKLMYNSTELKDLFKNEIF